MQRLFHSAVFILIPGSARASFDQSKVEDILSWLAIVSWLITALIAIVALTIPVAIANWRYSKVGGWGVVTMLALGGIGAYLAPPLTKELIVVLAWGMAFTAALLTRIAGHLFVLSGPMESTAPVHVPESGHWVDEASDTGRLDPRP